MFRLSVRPFGTCLAIVLLAGGCGSGPKLYKVSGTVKYEDGSAPKALMATITFQPAGDPNQGKGASGKIEPDGSFKLSTLGMDDGAWAGEYNVTFAIFDKYPGGESVVASEYTSAQTTPYKNVKIEAGKTKFDFVIKKRDGAT